MIPHGETTLSLGVPAFEAYEAREEKSKPLTCTIAFRVAIMVVTSLVVARTLVLHLTAPEKHIESPPKVNMNGGKNVRGLTSLNSGQLHSR